MKNLMYEAIEAKLDIQRKHLTLLLLEKLLRKGVGTNQVEHMVKQFKVGGGRVMSDEKKRIEKEKMINSHMIDKVKDAKIQLYKAKHRQERIQRFIECRMFQ